MLIWLDQLPTWAAFLVTVAIANAVAVSVMLAGRWWSQRAGVTSAQPVVGAWATCVGALTGLLFAFSIVTVWNSAARARSNVDDEAAAVRLVARDVAPAQRPLLRAYVDGTVAEWPQLCGGKRNPDVAGALAALQQAAQPRSSAYADDLYRHLASLEDLRNRRWQTATSSIPNEIWIALIVVSCSLLTVLGLALTDRAETHVVLMIALATVLGSLFWVATVLEYPFCGHNGIGPEKLLDIARTQLAS